MTYQWWLGEGYDKVDQDYELHDGLLFVSDNASARIFAFDTEGVLIDYLDTDLQDGALMGMAFDGSGALWLVDAERDEVLRISVD